MAQRFTITTCLLLAGMLAGCGGGFDPGSELQTLRVLGVQKSVPYPRPGEDVTLSILWHDGRPTDPEQPAQDFSDPTNRPVSVLWLPVCKNPPGDLYQGCFGQIGLDSAPNLQGQTLSLEDLSKDRVTFTIPEDILEGREALPGQPRYGLFYTLFAVCAGQLDFSKPGLPECIVDSGERRVGNSEEYVIGYSAMYVFEKNPRFGETPEAPEFFRNQNPTFTSEPTFAIGGEFYRPDCVDPVPEGSDIPSCITEAGGQLPLPEGLDESSCDASSAAALPAPCVKACADDGEPECPGIEIRPSIDPNVAERDDVSIAYYNRNVGEQMWVNYYVDGGGLKSEVRLVSDAQAGFNSKYQTELYAPKAPGLTTIWAVVHDNRGGQSFMRKTLVVRE